MSVDAVAISRSALDVEWQRLEVIARNLANENSTRVGEGGAYRPLRLVSGPIADFGTLIAEGGGVPRPQGVEVKAVEAGGGFRLIHDPGHPDADGDGFVRYPEMDRAAEMALLVKTARIYESNLTAMALAQQMATRALDIGRR